MARHQVKLNVAPPLHSDVRTQRRLKTAMGFDKVLAAVQPLSNALSALPDRVVSLERQLRAAQTEAAAAVRSVAPGIMTRENAEAYLKAASAEVKALRKDVKILRESNAKNNAMLASVQSSMEQHSEDLKRLHCEVQARDAVIATLNKKLAREREVYKSSIGASTEQTRQLHLLLVKLSKGKYIDNDTLKVLEDPQARSTHLLQVSRTLRAHVSLTGMDPEFLRLAVDGTFLISATNVHSQSFVTGHTAGELDLEALDLDQETLEALQRIQSAAASSHDSQALPAAVAQADHQVPHGKLHKHLRPCGKESDDESEDSDEVKAPIPTDKASTSMAAAGLGDAPPADSSTPKSACQLAIQPEAWKQAAQKKRQKTRLRSPAKSPRRHMKTRSKSTSAVTRVTWTWLTRVPSAQDTITESSGKDVGSVTDHHFSEPYDAPSPPPQGPPVVVKPSASTISPSPADIRAAEEALREDEDFRLMFGSDNEDDESDNTVPSGKVASSSVATYKTVEILGEVSTAGLAPVEAAPPASESSKPAPTIPTAAAPSVPSTDFPMAIDDDGNGGDDHGDDLDDDELSVDHSPGW
ncbi:hypothetical protein PInf_002546 [Phytophthora infestans]|nr:hypothetical protein PInf_002546 [Phytophthora infestans]